MSGSHELRTKGGRARQVARRLATLDRTTKDRVLESVARTLIDRRESVLEANGKDLQAGREAGLSEALLDRLLLNEDRIRSMADDVRKVAALDDPVGEEFDSRTLANGLRLSRRRVPIGVVGIIYESRPNVTIDVSALCLKSGNAALLRGGKEARHTNRVLAELVASACRSTSESLAFAVQLIETAERTMVLEMLQAVDFIDLIIPRGGAGLHRFALENSRIPVVTGGIGICHAYVDLSADTEKTLAIVRNAKVQRPTVCNALDTLLIHRDRAEELLPRIADDLARLGVELRCEERALRILGGHPAVRPAGEDDFDTEFLSLVLAVKVVDDLDQALDHIFRHSTRHSEAIVTEEEEAAERFLSEVDSAAVYVNASTRFTDGGQFGLGAEVAVSTQRLHARGPMGLTELTTYKWVGRGTGQVRD